MAQLPLTDAEDLASENIRKEPSREGMASQLHGPLTALYLYIDEMHRQAKVGSCTEKERDYFLQLANNARTQAVRALAIVTPTPAQSVTFIPPHRGKWRKHSVMLASDGDAPSLTKRERETLDLIVEGCSNREGALRMMITKRTFESHRAEVMRKLNARNAVDLVRLRMGMK